MRRVVVGVDVVGPERRVVEFLLDDEGDWVAVLNCGHRQHVRHRPPLESRPWVLDEAGRQSRIGVALNCRNCLMPTLPPDAVCYRHTDWFDQDTIPPGLAKVHRLRDGTWGRIRLEAGLLLYTILGESPLSFVLTPSLPGIIEPLRPHHVSARGTVRFRVEFLGTAGTPGGAAVP